MARGTLTTAAETLRRAGSLGPRSTLMKYLLMLAAAASLAACHQRSEDEVGAAPDQGDTTTVTATDTATVTATDTTAVIDDTTAVITDTTAVTDTTMGQTPTDTGFVQQDTTGF